MVSSISYPSNPPANGGLQNVPCTPSSITNLSIGSTEQLTSVSGATFTSKDNSIATVDSNGLVEGIATGTTKIIVSATGYKDIEVDVEVI